MEPLTSSSFSLDASAVWKHNQSRIHGTALSMIRNQMCQRKTGTYSGRTVWVGTWSFGEESNRECDTRKRVILGWGREGDDGRTDWENLIVIWWSKGGEVMLYASRDESSMGFLEDKMVVIHESRNWNCHRAWRGRWRQLLICAVNFNS